MNALCGDPGTTTNRGGEMEYLVVSSHGRTPYGSNCQDYRLPIPSKQLTAI
jgi:hypothetical protein